MVPTFDLPFPVCLHRLQDLDRHDGYRGPYAAPGITGPAGPQLRVVLLVQFIWQAASLPQLSKHGVLL